VLEKGYSYVVGALAASFLTGKPSFAGAVFCYWGGASQGRYEGGLFISRSMSAAGDKLAGLPFVPVFPTPQRAKPGSRLAQLQFSEQSGGAQILRIQRGGYLK